MRLALTTALVAILTVAAGVATAGEQRVTLFVDNMVCEGCPFIFKKTLAGVSDVKAVKVSKEKKTAVVRYDDRATTVAHLVEALAKNGYEAKIVP